MKVFFLFLTAFILFSCEEEITPRPANILSEDEFINVLADFHIMDAASKQSLVNNNHVNWEKHHQYHGILKLHNIPKAKFDSTVNYYITIPDEYKKLYEKVEMRLSKEKEKYQD